MTNIRNWTAPTFLYDAWLHYSNHSLDDTQVDNISYDKLRREEGEKISPIIELLLNRIVMGGLRYGRILAKNKPDYARIPRALQEISLYQADFNQEHLLDAINMLILEILEQKDPRVCFSPLDDALHTKRKK